MNIKSENFEGVVLKTGHCSRAAFLLDAKEYFSAVAESIRYAEKSVLIIGWDIDSRVQLNPEHSKERLCDLLNSAVEQHPDLQIHILIWDFPMAYSLDREPLQLVNFTRSTHQNIHFHLDSELPVNSSHHQKIVVVDDKVSFVGGMDLTSGRWDTPEHRAEDNRRIKPTGDSFGPYHDIQMVVDGELASIFGWVARKRWMWATGNDLSTPRDVKNDPWPKSIAPQFYDETGGVAQTLPRYKERDEVREVESIYLHALKKARSSIYIENQYLTSSTIQQALAQKLNDENSPEIVIVLPRMTSGLLEQLVMEPLQSEILNSLYAVDKHRRLGVYCPFSGDDNQVAVKVHAKVMIIDDEFFTVGSANLNERSMGLDTECNLVMRLKNNAVRQFRHRLIAHHLGVDTESYARMESELHSTIKAVEKLSLEQDGLLSESDTRDKNALPVDSEMARPLDTSEPSVYDSIMDDYSIGGSSRESFFRFLGFGVTLSALILLALLWRFTPLSEFATPDNLLNWADIIRQLPFSPVLAILAFILGGLIMFPVILLIILTASIFEPVSAFIISLTGSLFSALLIYTIGSLLGHKSVSKISGSKIHTLSKRLGQYGLPSVMAARILPVAPFSIINLIAGASHIHVGIFLLGTALGMAPGIIAMTLFGGQLMNVLRDPRPGPFAILASITLLVIGLGVLLSRRLRRLGKGNESSSGSKKEAE